MRATSRRIAGLIAAAVAIAALASPAQATYQDADPPDREAPAVPTSTASSLAKLRVRHRAGGKTPASPHGVSVAPFDRGLAVSWERVPSSDVTGYVVYWATSPKGPWRQQSVGSAITSTTIGGLVNRKAYWVQVAARDAAGTLSARSRAVKSTVVPLPSPPSAPSATPGNARVLLAWLPPASTGGQKIAGYRISTWVDGRKASGVLTAGANERSREIADLELGHVYEFAVAAQTRAGAGAPSAKSLPFVASRIDLTDGTVMGSTTDIVSAQAIGGQTSVRLRAQPPAVGQSMVVPGNVAVPTGVSGKVVSRQQGSDGTWTVVLSPQPLDKLFTDLEVHTKTSPTQVAAMMSAYGLKTRRLEARGLDCGPSVTVPLTLAPAFALDLGGSVDFSLRKREARMLLTGTLTLSQEAAFEEGLSCTFETPTIPITIAPVVLEFGGLATMSVGGKLSGSAQATMALSLGFDTHDGQTTNLSSARLGAEGELTTPADGVALTVGVGGFARTTLFSVVGVELSVVPNLRADVYGDPGCFTIGANVDVGLNAVVDAWWKDWSWGIASTSFAGPRLVDTCAGEWRGTLSVTQSIVAPVMGYGPPCPGLELASCTWTVSSGTEASYSATVESGEASLWRVNSLRLLVTQARQVRETTSVYNGCAWSGSPQVCVPQAPASCRTTETTSMANALRWVSLGRNGTTWVLSGFGLSAQPRWDTEQGETTTVVATPGKTELYGLRCAEAQTIRPGSPIAAELWTQAELVDKNPDPRIIDGTTVVPYDAYGTTGTMTLTYHFEMVPKTTP